MSKEIEKHNVKRIEEKRIAALVEERQAILAGFNLGCECFDLGAMAEGAFASLRSAAEDVYKAKAERQKQAQALAKAEAEAEKKAVAAEAEKQAKAERQKQAQALAKAEAEKKL